MSLSYSTGYLLQTATVALWQSAKAATTKYTKHTKQHEKIPNPKSKSQIPNPRSEIRNSAFRIPRSAFRSPLSFLPLRLPSPVPILHLGPDTQEKRDAPKDGGNEGPVGVALP